MPNDASPLPRPSLPDLKRPGLEPVEPALLRFGASALAATWRVTHPTRADRYVLGELPPPVRLYYTAQDGWQAPLFFLPPTPGGRGEPVLLAHGLGGSWRDFAVDPAHNLAQTLREAGFAVYLFEHRGDRSALPPANAAPFTVDDVAVYDVDAALEAIRAHSGYARVLWLGHGLGAQLLYLRLALAPDDAVVAAVTLGGAVRFPVSASAARAAGRVATLLPSRWVLPTRRAQQLLSPFVTAGDELASPDTSGPAARTRLRYASGDLHGGVVRQVARWVATGQLTDATGRVDVVAALRPFPALVVEPDADPACPVGAAEPAAAPLEAGFRRLEGGWGHLDPLIGARAPTELHPLLTRFLVSRRERCW